MLNIIYIIRSILFYIPFGPDVFTSIPNGVNVVCGGGWNVFVSLFWRRIPYHSFLIFQPQVSAYSDGSRLSPEICSSSLRAVRSRVNTATFSFSKYAQVCTRIRYKGSRKKANEPMKFGPSNPPDCHQCHLHSTFQLVYL